MFSPEQVIRFECVKLIASLGVSPDQIKEFSMPLSEWILNGDHAPPKEISDITKNYFRSLDAKFR